MQNIFITGANRGIGLAFTKKFLQRGDNVFACCRDISLAIELQNLAIEFSTLTIIELDVTCPASIARLNDELGGSAIELLINNAGYYGPKNSSFGDIDTKEWLKVLSINTIAPLKVTESLLENLKLTKNAKIACISSKMGSIDDNSSGGAYIYRSSKTALNSVVKSLSHDLSQYGISVVSLHPGWVKTDMGGENALIDTECSVNGMIKVLDKLTLATSGQFINYDGAEIPW